MMMARHVKMCLAIMINAIWLGKMVNRVLGTNNRYQFQQNASELRS